MLPNDLFCRAFTYPKVFENQTMDPEQMYRFEKLPDTPEWYATSIASKYLLRTELDIHRWGESIARSYNERFLERKGEYPDPLRAYLCYFEIFWKYLSEIRGVLYDIYIKYCPEKGCDAHYNIEIRPKDRSIPNRKAFQDLSAKDKKKKLREDRNEIAYQFYISSKGPNLKKMENYTEIEINYLRILKFL